MVLPELPLEHVLLALRLDLLSGLGQEDQFSLKGDPQQQLRAAALAEQSTFKIE